MYDIFYVSKTDADSDTWESIREKYPTAQRIDNITSLDQIQSKAFTKMFWIIWDDLILTDFDLTGYRATKWDDMYVHVFKNSEHYDGICLFPKQIQVSQREFNNRFFIAKKEVDIIASTPKPFDKFYISTYDQYLEAIKVSKSEMFWCIWPDITVESNFNFDYKVAKHNSNIVHVFKNGEHYDGICLFPRDTVVTKREFHHRFFTNKKEVDIIASRPNRYSIYRPSTYDQYLEIKDEMFWIVWPQVEILDDTIFDLYFSHHNSYDRRENHVFKNLCNDTESFLSGVLLCSKFKQLSKREFDKQYAIDKKEHNIVISRYRYPKYVIKNYNEYKEICKTESNKMFWCVWPELEVTDHTIFDLYFDPNDGLYDYDREENHVFKNVFKEEETHANGVVLFSKDKIIGNREFTHRFLIHKKEHDRVVSKMKLYDVVFISYNESNADENYNRLLKKCTNAKRVHGVKGIHQAHIKAASLCNTDMFWVVDGDAVLESEFDFNYELSTYERDIVHVWRSKNPINNLVYGYGGVKLLPRELTLAVDVNAPDMTTSISKKFKAVSEISNITAFNTDPFNTWKSAFRECVKLASKTINRQVDEETQYRLTVWTTAGADQQFGTYAIAGAKAGRDYGEANVGNVAALAKINDFDWLKRKFDEI
jgi:hypothetical protein